jgi:hypothetical protein
MIAEPFSGAHLLKTEGKVLRLPQGFGMSDR